MAGASSVHEAWRYMGRRINVGVDVWNWAPVSAFAIKWHIEAAEKNPELLQEQ